jgi:hypothetical protein
LVDLAASPPGGGQTLPLSPPWRHFAITTTVVLVDAAHEAGHAVISIFEGRAFVSVTLEPTHDPRNPSNAHIEYPDFPERHHQPYGFAPEDIYTSSVARDRLRRWLHITLAGGEADRLVFGEHGELTDLNDIDIAEDLLATATRINPSIIDHLDIFRQETRLLVVEHQQAIMTVTAALQEHRTLRFAQVCELVLPEASSREYEPSGWTRSDGRGG